MRTMLPEGSRNAQSRGPQGWSMGSCSTSAPDAPHLLEGRVEIVGAEDDHRQDSLAEQFLQGVAVGLGSAGVRLGDHELKAWLRRRAQGNPAEPVRRDVVARLKAQRVAVGGERVLGEWPGFRRISL
jgi:hypothetical protein